MAYDFVLEVAMKVQDFKPRNLLLHGSWKWLVTEFASYYGVSDAYTKLRYFDVVGYFPCSLIGKSFLMTEFEFILIKMVDFLYTVLNSPCEFFFIFCHN